MVRLLYISTATDKNAVATELLPILEVAQRRNLQHGITGALLAYGSYFMQVLEGAERAVDATFARISADPRHHSIRLVERKAIPARRFAAWSMRHVAPSQGNDRAVTGFLQQLSATPDADQAHLAEALLEQLSAQHPA